MLRNVFINVQIILYKNYVTEIREFSLRLGTKLELQLFINNGTRVFG